MQLSKQQVETIIKNAPAGTDKTKLLNGLVSRGYELEGVDMNAARQFATTGSLTKPITNPVPTQEKSSFLDRQKRMIQEKSGNIVDIQQDPTKSALSKGIGTTAQAFSAVSGTAYNALPEVGRKAVDFIAGKIGKGAEDVTNWLADKPLIMEAAMSGETGRLEQALEGAGGLGLIAGEIAGAGEAAIGGQKILNKTVDATRSAANTASRLATEVADNTGGAVRTAKDSFVKALSPEIDDSVKTVLQKTNPTKFDEFVETASQNATDNTAPSVYEKVADSMSNATEQIANQTRSLSQQKNAIISKAKNGLSDFTKETGETILDINRALKNSPVAKSFIQRLKTVKNKIDADKAIDELQDILYRGKKDMTIPVGSIEERTLSSIIGKYNSKLKEGLPTSYTKINKEIADRLTTLDDLNRALGEVVEGVPIRGAGLVKQFFSPAGTKAKQLFQFVKKNTGIDLAEDAVLAKYIGDAFGDAKVRSLLEGGIPTSTGGVIDRTLNFALEKTGANKALGNARREGMIGKARDYLNSAKNTSTPTTTPKTPVSAISDPTTTIPTNIKPKAGISSSSTATTKKSSSLSTSAMDEVDEFGLTPSMKDNIVEAIDDYRLNKGKNKTLQEDMARMAEDLGIPMPKTYGALINKLEKLLEKGR